MILQIILSCIAGYILFAGLFVIFRRDAVWQYQHYRRTGDVTTELPPRSPDWDASMAAIGIIGAVIGGGVLALLWL